MRPLPGVRCQARAFTLIELLVAMTILCLLVVTLFGLVDGATKLWRDNENRVDAFREARAALNIINEDVQAFPGGTNLDSFLTNDTLTNGLFLLSLQATSAQPSDRGKSGLCGVGYFLAWGPQTKSTLGENAKDPTRRGYHLYRSMYASDLTYSNLITGKKALTNLSALVGPDVEPEILARNVLGFDVRCYQINPDYKTNATAAVKAPFLKWTQSAATPYPDMVEVRITAIPEEAARNLAGNKDRWITNDPIVAREKRVFVSRIRLNSVSTN